MLTAVFFPLAVARYRGLEPVSPGASRTESGMTSVLSLDAAPPDQRFVALYEAHAGAVLAYARRRCGADEAEDVLAETFLVAWRRRGDVPGDALPWLYAVARNVVRNRRARSAGGAALEARMAARARRRPRRRQDARPAAARRRSRRLKPIDREALLLTAWEGLSAERAARAAGCTPARPSTCACTGRASAWPKLWRRTR